jgi:hypothetical protein
VLNVPTGTLTEALASRPLDTYVQPRSVQGVTVAFTSINWQYLPKALVLAESLKRFHRDWQFHILLNDHVPVTGTDLPNVDAVVPISGVGIDNFHSWCFGHDVVELCTATKAFYFRALFELGCERVFYFDPDIEIFSTLDLLQDELSAASVLLTPHTSVQASRDAEILYTEMSVLAHGLYNLGFIGVNNDTIGRQVIDFWCRRMERYCYDDHGRGLFTDQKWFNLVPLYFDRVNIMRHRGCNTASWNLAGQLITRKHDRYYVGEDPLLFFHFSGYDAAVPRRMFEIFGAFNTDIAYLIDAYDSKVEQWKSREECHFPWVYSRFDNGAPVTKSVRRFYRNRLENRLTYPAPFLAETWPSFYKAVHAVGELKLESEYDPPGMLRRYF